MFLLLSLHFSETLFIDLLPQIAIDGLAKNKPVEFEIRKNSRGFYPKKAVDYQQLF
jgi:hypothetical protein